MIPSTICPRSAWKWTAVFGSPEATRFSVTNRFHEPWVKRASFPRLFPFFAWERISSTIWSCSSSGMLCESFGACLRTLSFARDVSSASWSIISSSPSHSVR